MRIGRLTRPSLAQDRIAELVTWCRENKADCVYLFLAGDSTAPAGMENYGELRHTGDRLGLVYEESDDPRFAPSGRIAAWSEADLPELREIAEHSHHQSRFYRDHGFPRPKCDALYATWIENACRGYADAVFVAKEDSRAVGYLTCRRDPEGNGRIGLVAVHPECRHRGLGGELVQAGLNWLFHEHLSVVKVDTQADNAAARGMYTANGFQRQELISCLHFWPAIDE